MSEQASKPTATYSEFLVLRWGLTILAAIGGLVTTLAIGYAVSEGIPFDVQKQVYRTEYQVRMLAYRVDSYVADHGESPSDLTSLGEPPGSQPNGITAPSWVDHWGQPFQYQKTGQTTYDLYSLGRDGLPGGLGLDSDIRPVYRSASTFAPYRLSLPQYLIASGNRRMILAAALTALAFAGIQWVSFRPDLLNQPTRTWRLCWSVIGSLLGIVVASLITGLIMAVHYAIDADAFSGH